MNDRNSDIADDTLSDPWFENICDNAPRVHDGVILVEMVLASVPGYFQLVTNPYGAAHGFTNFNGLDDIVTVLFEI